MKKIQKLVRKKYYNFMLFFKNLFIEGKSLYKQSNIEDRIFLWLCMLIVSFSFITIIILFFSLLIDDTILLFVIKHICYKIYITMIGLFALYVIGFSIWYSIRNWYRMNVSIKNKKMYYSIINRSKNFNEYAHVEHYLRRKYKW